MTHHPDRRWTAGLCLAFGALAVLTLLLAAGFRSITLLAAGTLALAVTVVALWWALTHRGLVRFLSGILAVAAPVAAAMYYIAMGLLWAVLLSAALWTLTVLTGRAALSAGTPATVPAPAPPARRPVVFMNPRSGGGKVERFHLADKARGLGADVVLLDPAHPAGVAALAAEAVAAGADLLGVAGGDGTQALVAGAYAAIVRSPAYRDGKVRTSLQLLPELLTHHQGPRLSVRAGNVLIEAPQALLVSNNPYQGGDPSGFGRRERLDAGVLGVLAVTVDSAAQAAGLLRGRHGPGLSMLTASEVVIDSECGEIPVGVDGEALTLPTPVICGIQPGGLRVRVPRDHRMTPPPRPRLDWRRLSHLAFSHGRSV
ncbi:diacylglycerol/lipid kinase family protein [Actinomadura latina]|uniref:Diacylglycerol kinase n=1 Tax=Actinomadura latina TaxID=163603 RepID=A0A846Z1Q6_9ACTN|nr:diacylglycerol kinase family protein [Actinomadura latina]NKZ04256.1 diacylglycerol kinase [Actinomadura latina]